VTITIMVSALNSWVSIAPRLSPICAKISPTSPRGIMATPINALLPRNHHGA
jgi:hypothetical protein